MGRQEIGKIIWPIKSLSSLRNIPLRSLLKINSIHLREKLVSEETGRGMSGRESGPIQRMHLTIGFNIFIFEYGKRILFYQDITLLLVYISSQCYLIYIWIHFNLMLISSILLLKKIQNPKKAFCLVLIFALIRMVHLYIQEKDLRITDLQDELRYVSKFWTKVFCLLKLQTDPVKL